ncbi:DUF3383 family protein [Paenibacillus sp. S-38]|uniref:DUF3383 family protein n=1 Tax=Paenibacillus sp. S-38 TaxID=3416710 RepID=UPI003CF524B6
MPLKDVKVTISLSRPAGLIGFGKPLIIGPKTGGQAYKNYSDLTALVADGFAVGSEVYKAAAAVMGQGDNRPQVFAVAAYDSGGTSDALDVLTANYSKDWYFLISTSTVKTEVIELSNYVEGQGRKLFVTRTSSLTDLADLKATGNELTFVMYHSDPDEVAKYPDAAWVGRVGSRTVGTVTWKGQRLVGILPDDLDAAGLQGVHDNGGNAYVTKSGTPVTSEGQVLTGEYIDVIMGNHWVAANIEEQVQALFNSGEKISYTNGGISQIESVVRTVLGIAYRQEIIAEDADGIPLYSTDFPTRAETTAIDRAERILRNAKFTYELAGAIHAAEITGTVSV